MILFNPLSQTKRAIKHKYSTKIYYIHQEPEIAWQFTKDRELIEKRHIDRNGFMDTYFSLQENLNNLQNQSKNIIISIILKDKSNKVGRIIENVDDISNHVPQPLNREQLEHVILD